jgi:hypothetical protein
MLVMVVRLMLGFELMRMRYAARGRETSWTDQANARRNSMKCGLSAKTE